MVLIKNKKGMFFTVFVMVVLSLFLLNYNFLSGIKERKTVQDRITTLNNFVFSLEKDLPRQLYISAFRITFLLEKRIIEKGVFIPNINNAFNEAFFNGTILNETSSEIQTIMSGAKFLDILNNIKTKANSINADVEINNPSIKISQETPWQLKFTLSSNLVIKDLTNLAIWNKTENITAYISIENFEDPLYIVNTNGVSTNKIIKSPYNTFVSGSDISNLKDHALNSYYIASATAPTFLDRLEGKTSSDPNGIESLVNLAELGSQGIPTYSKSVVDYIYFSTSSPSSCNVIPIGMPSWFKLDNDHLPAYQVSCAS